jgi:hypothetical protein
VISDSFTPCASAGRTGSDSEKAEALADSLEVPFQLVNDLSQLAVTEIVVEAMHANKFAHASEPNLISPSDVLQAIKGLKVGKASCTNSILNSVLSHLLKHAIIFFTKAFIAV